MSDPQASKSVVVGIDGSRAAINTAKWAASEARVRGIPLRLIHVIPINEAPAAPNGVIPSDIERAECALGDAEAAVDEIAKHREVETAILRGDPAGVLIDESRKAAMVCVGSAATRPGVGSAATRPGVGPTAAELAKHAHCPVAIVRTNAYDRPSDSGVIAVVLNDEPDNDEVVHHAMNEGRLRRATVQQIDRRLNSWVRRYPDVPVETVAAGTGTRYAENHSSAIQLAVVGRSDGEHIAELVTPNSHPILGYPDCSVLVVRN